MASDHLASLREVRDELVGLFEGQKMKKMFSCLTQTRDFEKLLELKCYPSSLSTMKKHPELKSMDVFFDLMD